METDQVLVSTPISLVHAAQQVNNLIARPMNCDQILVGTGSVSSVDDIDDNR